MPQTRGLSTGLVTRRIETLQSIELRFGWRTGSYNNGRTEDVNDTSGVRCAWVASLVRIQIGLEKKLPSAHDDDWTEPVSLVSIVSFRCALGTSVNGGGLK